MRLLYVAIFVFFSSHVCLAQSDLDTKLKEFRSQAEEFNKKAYKKQRSVFVSTENIKKLCAVPIRIPDDEKRDVYFKKMADDPASLPRVDCLFVATGDGSDVLFSFAPLPNKAGFVSRKQSWVTPAGLISFHKHPLHDIRMLWGGKWRLNRIRLSPDTVFPITSKSRFSFAESKPNETDQQSRLWVERSFVIKRKGKIIDQLHLIIRDYGVRKFLGSDVPMRSWYLYSQKANALIRKSLPYGPDALSSMENTKLLKIGYFRGGQLIEVLSTTEMKPVRDYLSTFKLWKKK